MLALLYLLRLIAQLCRERPLPDPARCPEVPPIAKRKPDPCLYDQFYLAAQGLAVTWDNPDIWLTLPDGTPVASHQLAADTDYLVHARIHDASFDPALATEVRCFYRPWSFGTPDRTPVETNPDGSVKVIVLHIPPWASQVAVFRMHTPNTPGQHYCIQAECRHPDDKNPNNNLGQENLQLAAGNPGQQLIVHAPLFNGTRRRQAYRILADAYAIPKGELTLRLETRERAIRRRKPFDALHNLLLTRDAATGRLQTQRGRALKLISYAYRGFEEVRRSSRRGLQPAPPAWAVEVNGEPLQQGAGAVTLDPAQQLAVPLALRIPADATPGSQQRFNFAAFNPAGKLIGGVTLLVEVT